MTRQRQPSSSATTKKRSSNSSGKTSSSSPPAQPLGDEFQLVPQKHDDDSNVSVYVIQNCNTRQYLCSSKSGGVYVSNTCCGGNEKWIMAQHDASKYIITSFVSGRVLACEGHTIHTIDIDDGYQQARQQPKESILWNIDLTSGELCFMTLPILQQRLSCNIMGNLSMRTNYLGCEAWRFTEVGNSSGHNSYNYVRISPWAHSDYLVSSDKDGNVTTTTQHRGSSEIWNIMKAPNGHDGVIIVSVEHGRVLSYNHEEESFCTVPGNKMFLVDEYCVWDLESLHRQTYYFVTSDGKKRLEGAKRGLTTRKLPNRVQSEEWKIELIENDLDGCIRLFSTARERYLVSNQEGEVFLNGDVQTDGGDAWMIEEQENGFVVRSYNTQRLLVTSDKEGTDSTVAPGTIVHGNTRWQLQPTIPRQINKDKLQAVGGAVAIGVIGTVAAPLLIGGVVGALGIAQVGVAGNIAIGSIRAVEAVNTITRVTLSSSQLMISQSSTHLSDSKHGSAYEEEEDQEDDYRNRPLCAWRSWK
jgi:hypothetical protein